MGASKDWVRWGAVWGKRLRDFARSKGRNYLDVAEPMGLSDSAIRSFTNGHRPPDLVEFMTMCELLGADPATILFGSPTVNDVVTQHFKALPAPPAKPPKRHKRVKEPA